MSQAPLAAIIRSSDRVAERQRHGTYHGDQDQLADVERYCKDRNLTYELLPPELDVSGGKPIEERPSLRAAIEGVEAGTYSGIVAANLKRLTRSRSGIQIWERVEAAGGHVHTAAEQLDTSTPNGRFMRDIFLADAVREREEHSVRHAERRRKTVEAGVWRQHQVPLGYQFTGPEVDGRYRGKARRLTPSPDADKVRRAFRDRAAGVPLVTIAEQLRMTPSGARYLLRNRLYIGEMHDGPTINPNAVEPLVDAATFEAAQIEHTRPARHTDDGPALLAGIARCSGCGHVMSRSRTASLVYRCAPLHSGGRCPAPAGITCSSIDPHMEQIALKDIAKLAISDSEGTAVQTAQAALANAEDELAGFLRFTSFKDAGFEAALKERRERVEAARSSLRALMARQPVMPAPEFGADVWEELTAWDRNRLLRGLYAAVYVTRSGRGRKVPVADRVRVVRVGDDFDGPYA